MPTAEPVVRDRADPRGERRKYERLCARNQRQHVLGDQRRADGIERKHLGHRSPIKPLVSALRPCAIGQGQHAGCDDDPFGGLCTHRLGGGGNAGLIGKIEGERANPPRFRPSAAARSGVNHLCPALGQLLAQSPADPARRTENAGRPGGARGALSYIIHHR